MNTKLKHLTLGLIMASLLLPARPAKAFSVPPLHLGTAFVTLCGISAVAGAAVVLGIFGVVKLVKHSHSDGQHKTVQAHYCSSHR